MVTLMNYETLLIKIHCFFLHTVSQGFITWWCLLIWLLCPHWPQVRCYLPGLPRVTDTSAGSLAGHACPASSLQRPSCTGGEREGGEYRSVIPRVWEIITSITSYFEFSWFAQLVHIAAPDAPVSAEGVQVGAHCIHVSSPQPASRG